MKSKLKTNKAMAKRIKVTKNNKFIAKKSCNNHLLTNKWKTNKMFKYWKLIAKVDKARIRNLIPYKLR